MKNNSGHKVFYAPNNETFIAKFSWQTQYLADGVHPNDAGYGAMAGVWRDAILDALGVIPNLTVAFNGVNATKFAVDSETRIRAVVPAGTATGKISVTTAVGTGVSASNFVVTNPILTFKQTDSAPSLAEIEQVILGQLSVDPCSDLDGDGQVDLVDLLQLMDGDSGSQNERHFSKRELSGVEASAAFVIKRG